MLDTPLKQDIPFAILMAFAIIGSLWFGNYFVYKSLTPYFIYTLGLSAFIIYSGFSPKTNSGNLNLSAPILIKIFLLLFTILHSLFFWTTIYPYSYYLFITFLCMIVMPVYWRSSALNIKLIFNIIIIAVIIESLICIFQYVGFLDTFNQYFKVTGTSENPNIIAMFIAISIPCIFTLSHNKHKFIRKSIPYVLIFLVGTLYLLECRSALLGSAIGIFIILNHKYQLYTKVKDKKNHILLILTAFIIISISFPLALHSYKAKQASADGRKLIWKVSAEMISHKPLFGYGYGAFERDYNLFQSRYFEKGDAQSNEINNAGFVKMAYNEVIQNTVEGGIVGGLLFIFMLFSLLYFPLKSNSTKIQDSKHIANNYPIVAYAGICIFITMSLVNFTIQALPVMFLFVIYSSILSANSPSISLPKGLLIWNKLISENNKKKYLLAYRLCLLVIGLCFMYMTGNLIIDNLKNKQAALLTKKGNYEKSLNILTSLQNRLNIYESYWVNYANTLFLDKDYKHATIVFKKAKLLTSNPMIYLQAAICDEKTGDYKSAYKNLTIAKNMEPGHLAAKFALMNLSLKMRDTAGCVNQAQNIMETVPKIRSSEAIFFKSRASLLLQRLGYSYEQKPNNGLPGNNKFYLPKKNI